MGSGIEKLHVGWYGMVWTCKIWGFSVQKSDGGAIGHLLHGEDNVGIPLSELTLKS